MPRNPDLKKILLLGSGPIVIGQGCEFDYSGTQACKALREEGYEVILLNSNPATIMTDPEFADRTYIEPITAATVEKILTRERPDAILPTLGGQTALNVAMELVRSGALISHGVKLIGANATAINKGEDRKLFKDAMVRIGLDVPLSGVAHSLDDARKVAAQAGRFPLIIRPAFTLGGHGGGIAYNREEFEEIVGRGLDLSPVSEVLIEESLIGWKEFEMEVIRDRADNCILVCSIENIDPMGVHTGDSITVAPIQTLSDRELQRMRDASFAVIREIGVETGGSNIQFAVHPETGRMVVIEMNPRVSRSSALASKATGYPIARVAAKLAVGYTLDELKNDITRHTPASFEPAIDYVVVKVPRFAFEKFPQADPTLTTSMKSVGEAMAIGRTFKEAMQKCLRSLETGRFGLGGDGKDHYPILPSGEWDLEAIRRKLIVPNAERVFFVRHAFLAGYSVGDVFEMTKIDPWFLAQFKQIVDEENAYRGAQGGIPLRRAKKFGFSDPQLAALSGLDEAGIRAQRKTSGIQPTYRLVDTCAAEFEAYTPYYYSTYGDEDETRPSDKRKVMILGGGPNRIGQGIEFDYCCVHAAFALREAGFETIMVNSNPETVSTDFDTSDKLYFEPLTLEDVLNIHEREQCWGAIVQFGGQTPLNLASELARNGLPIIGTPPASIDRAENRREFAAMLEKLGLRQPPNGTATDENGAVAIAQRLGWPVLVRPSFVLGGRAMEIIYEEERLRDYMKRQAGQVSAERPILVDRFLEDAIEVDVDCIADGETAVIGAVMEHVEQAGIHSGDSACVIPAFSLSPETVEEIQRSTKALAQELGVRGLMNVQFAVREGVVYVLEVNPRASRTIPFVSKAIGVPLAKLAARVMAGATLKELGFTKEIVPKHYSVKEAVFPFVRFPGVDITLGPEMRSTGEVMGIDDDLGLAFAKSQAAAGSPLPTKGNVFLSVKDADKAEAAEIAKDYVALGFTIYSTGGTLAALTAASVPAERINKLAEGRPHVLDMIKNGDLAFVINTPSGATPRADEVTIRTAAVAHRVPIMTTLSAARASAGGIRSLQASGLTVKTLQEFHAAMKAK